MTFADHLRTHQDAHNGGGEMPISYGSVCSGIEAASVAWHHLGWIPRWFAEIEPFPSAVLAHHWPEVSNLGDFTAIRDKVTAGTVEAPDVLVGGTPCQAFSVAGLRQSLDDKRGQLTLEFVRLADAIDSARSFQGQRPVTVVWENVPGVLNTPDNAFGCFLAGLVGEDDPLVAPGGRWSNAGYVRGPARAAAWRILDAQYFGVAQRRRRVFVVASAGGISPESVLFEFDGVRRDSPPRRETRQDLAPAAGTLAANGGGTGRGSGAIAVAHVEILPTMTSGGPKDTSHGQISGQMRDAYMVPVLGFNARQDPDSWEGRTGPLDTDGGTQAVAVAFQPGNLSRGAGAPPSTQVFPTLKSDHGRGLSDQQPHVAVAFSSKDYGADAGEIAPTMRSTGHAGSHANGGGQLAVAFGVSESPDLGHCLRSGASKADKHESTTYVQTAMQVRRLTPTEAERLQGFPDGHTRIPWRGKPADECPDGPRYKALGNSMAVPVMRWIGARIARQLEAQA